MLPFKNYKKFSFFFNTVNSTLELDVIKDEQTVRDMDNAKIMQDALRTGGVRFQNQNYLYYKEITIR